MRRRLLGAGRHTRSAVEMAFTGDSFIAGGGGANGTTRKALGRWSSVSSGEPTRCSPRSFRRRASRTSNLPPSGACGRNSPCCERCGAADRALSSRPRIAACGGCASKSSCNSLRSVCVSSSGRAGRTIRSCRCPPSRLRTKRSEAIASAFPLARTSKASVIRASKKSSDSKTSTGKSRFMRSTKLPSKLGSIGTIKCCHVPRASAWVRFAL